MATRKDIRTYLVGPGVLKPFETGAKLYALMAFPLRSEEQQMENAADALCANHLTLKATREPEDASKLAAAYEQYFNIEARERVRRIRTLNRRLRDRAVAGRMARAFFEQGMTGSAPKLPKQMKRPSLNELSQLVLVESGTSDPENVEKRIWRPTLPVIHLCSALQWMAMAADDLGNPYGGNIVDDYRHKVAVEVAERHEQIVLSDSRFGRGVANELIRLRWTD